jgi:hypothetical protein
VLASAVIGVALSACAATGFEGDPLPADPRIDALLAYDPPLALCREVGNDYLVVVVMPWQVDYLSQGAGVDENARMCLAMSERAFTWMEQVLGESPGNVFILADDSNSPGDALRQIYGRGGPAIIEPDLPDRYDEVFHHLVHAWGVGNNRIPAYMALKLDNAYARAIPESAPAVVGGPDLVSGYEASFFNEGVPTYLEWLSAYEVTGRTDFLGKLVEDYLIYRRLATSPRFRELAPVYVEGAVLNWALDEFIRSSTQGAKTIKDFLRDLMRQFVGREFTASEYAAVIRQTAGKDFSSNLRSILAGTIATVEVPDEYWDAYRDLIACKCADPYSLRGEWTPIVAALPQAVYYIQFEIGAVTPLPGPHLVFHGRTCGLHMDSIRKWLAAMLDICSGPSDLTEEMVEEALEVVTGEDESRFFEDWRALGFEVSLQELRDFLAGQYQRMVVGRVSAAGSAEGDSSVAVTQQADADAFADGLAGSEWDGLAPLVYDRQGDAYPPSADITAVYAVVRGDYLCMRMDCAGDLRPLEVRYNFTFMGDELYGDLESQMEGPPKLTVIRGGHELQYYATSAIGRVYEAVIPLDVLGRLPGIDIRAITQPVDQNGTYDGAESIIIGQMATEVAAAVDEGGGISSAPLTSAVGVDAFGDGLPGAEWVAMAPIARDAEGDVTPASSDATALYAVVRNDCLCLRMDYAGPFRPSEVRYCIYFRGSGLDGGVDFVADGPPRLTVIRDGQESEYYILGGMREVLEAVIPLDVLGRPSRLEINAVVQPFDQSWAYDGIETSIDGL